MHASPQVERLPGTGSRRRAITIERIVDCPFSRAIEQAELIFLMLRRDAGVRIPLRKLGLPFKGAITRRVAVRFHRQRDRTEFGRPHDEIDFDWCAEAYLLPDLHGVLRFRIARVKTRIIFQADYAPPFGGFGRLFDRIVGRHLARATAVDMLDRLTVILERGWAEERRRFSLID